MEDTNRTLSIAAIIISVVALLVSFTASNEVNVPNANTQEIQRDTEIALARAEARASLAATRADLAIDENYQEAAAEVAKTRADLAAAYGSASAEAQEDFDELDADLNNLENELRNESADALNLLESLISNLATEIRYDD